VTGRAASAALALLLALAAAGCGADGTTASSGTGTSATVVSHRWITSRVVGHLAEPTALVTRPGDDHLWAAERAGTIRRVAISADGNHLTPSTHPALDLTAVTSTDTERGLLDILFTDRGQTLWVSRTNLDGNTRVETYRMDGDRILASTRRVRLAVVQPFPNHNGGNLELGPDGRVWFGLGDGGAADDPLNNAQNPRTQLGKILRFGPGGTAPEIMVSGVRNPWRFSFDTDRSLWISDVGQDTTEEIDHLPASAIRGANLGWSGYEGNHRHVPGAGRAPAHPVVPVFTYTHADGSCSIIGGFTYHGRAMPGLRGAYLFTDYCKGDVLGFEPDPVTASRRDVGYSELFTHVHVDAPISFAEDAHGEPFVLTEGGEVVRLLPAA